MVALGLACAQLLRQTRAADDAPSSKPQEKGLT
jgi:hypothetical protein